MNATEPQINEITPEEIAGKFSGQEAQLVKQEQVAANLRAFFAKHREALSPFVWKCYGWDDEVEFDIGYSNPVAKPIARAFGADGWTRKANSYTCGAINWHKTVDGVRLTIRNAESLKPKLIAEVKL